MVRIARALALLPAQVLAPAKTVIENTGATLDLKERESHLWAWGVKKVSSLLLGSGAGRHAGSAAGPC